MKYRVMLRVPTYYAIEVDADDVNRAFIKALLEYEQHCDAGTEVEVCEGQDWPTCDDVECVELPS